MSAHRRLVPVFASVARLEPTDTLASIVAPADLVASDAFHEPELFCRVPWFDHLHWRDADLVRAYALPGGPPGRIPPRALDFLDWELHFFFPDHLLLLTPGQSFFPARRELVRLLQKYVRRVSADYPVAVTSGLDIWAFRTNGEAAYAEKLMAFGAWGWRRRFGVLQDDLLFSLPLLRADFRSRRYGAAHNFIAYLKWERSARSRTGFLVPYKLVEIDRPRHSARGSRYVRIPPQWSVWECCRGLLFMLPASPTYL